MLVDSHCHLDLLNLKNHNGDLNKAILSAQENGVDYILCPSVTFDGFSNVLKIAIAHSNVFAAVGVHPTENFESKPTLEELVRLGDNKKVVGIGETGLDFYRCSDNNQRGLQKELFKLHIQAAKILNKPLIIHSRDADEDIYRILLEEKNNITGVIHCYTGNLDFANIILDLGFYISFSGIVTFPKAHILCEVAKNIVLEKILIETDAPYLAPVPMRGKPNEPAYLRYIAEFIAKTRGISYESFALGTAENFFRLFKAI